MSLSHGIRLVATDLDGTLVHSDGSITARTRAALAAVDEAGISVVFVTGRPLRWTREVFDAVGPHGLAVVSNGALVWDVAADREVLSRCIPVDVGLGAVRDLRAAVPGSVFAVEHLDGIALENGFAERHPIPPGALRGTAEEIFDQPIVKLLARHEELTPQEFWDAAEAVIGDRVTITWSSTSTLLEISAAGVTKASTLELLCDEQGLVAGQVLAVGDMPNDLPMLEWAGTSYAMANAHPTVLQAADRVALGNDDDGVAVILEGLLT